jgi:long-chain fatty acid transport protein
VTINRKSTFTRLGLAAGATVLFSAPAFATAGMFALGYSTNQRAMGGAGVSYGYDAMSAAVNPANAVDVGHQFQMGIDIFMPDRGFTNTNVGSVFPFGGTATSISGTGWFPVPNLSYNRPLDNGAVFNVSVYGNGGMNTDFSDPVFGFSPTGIDLSQVFVSLTYADKIGNVAWGISPTIVGQRFQAQGLLGFGPQSTDPTLLSDNGFDFSYGMGLKFGATMDVAPGLKFGISANTKMEMSKLNKYAGLFENGGSMDIPASITVGLTWDANPDTKFMVDYQRIFYSGVPAISNGNTGPLGAVGGTGFGWDNVGVIKLGVEWKANEQLTLRGGYAYSTNPVGPEDIPLAILAPGVVKHHITFGGSYAFSEKNGMDFAIEYAPRNSVTAAGGGASLEVFMKQISVSLGWTHNF